MPFGRLYVVATPIGNLEDITLRAIRVLGEVDLIAAEDTRHSRALLARHGITARLTSYHEHNEHAKTFSIISELEAGHDVALITDAGTPCIADPGYRLVHAARERGVCVYTIPGPCAAVAALSISGLPSSLFTFHGFFPRKTTQALAILEEAASQGGTHIFYEAPNRVLNTINILADRYPASSVALARELTKLHEEVLVDSPRNLINHLAESHPKGECVLLMSFPASSDTLALDEPGKDQIRTMVEEAMLQEGLSRRDAVQMIASKLKLPKNRVYAAATEPPSI